MISLVSEGAQVRDEWRLTKIKVNLFNGRTNLQYLSIFDNRMLNLCYNNIVVLKLINSSDRIIGEEEKKKIFIGKPRLKSLTLEINHHSVLQSIVNLKAKLIS